MSSKNKKLLTALGVAAVVVIVIAAVLLGKGGQTTTVDPASTPSDAVSYTHLTLPTKLEV